MKLRLDVKCQKWMKVFWMKVSLDEIVFGLKCRKTHPQPHSPKKTTHTPKKHTAFSQKHGLYCFVPSCPSLWWSPFRSQKNRLAIFIDFVEGQRRGGGPKNGQNSALKPALNIPRCSASGTSSNSSTKSASKSGHLLKTMERQSAQLAPKALDLVRRALRRPDRPQQEEGSPLSGQSPGTSLHDSQDFARDTSTNSDHALSRTPLPKQEVRREKCNLLVRTRYAAATVKRTEVRFPDAIQQCLVIMLNPSQLETREIGRVFNCSEFGDETKTNQRLVEPRMSAKFVTRVMRLVGDDFCVASRQKQMLCKMLVRESDDKLEIKQFPHSPRQRMLYRHGFFDSDESCLKLASIPGQRRCVKGEVHESRNCTRQSWNTAHLSI